MAWQRSPRVVYEVVDSRAVLVDPEGVELLTLNAVGTLVWAELDGARGPVELAAALIDRVEGIGLAEFERDIAEFLVEIEAAGLVCGPDGAVG